MPADNSGRGGRRRRGESKESATPVRPAQPNRAQLDHLLDAFEAAMLERREVEVHALTSQLWEGRRLLPEVLVERLREGRSRLPALSFELLGGMAGAKAPTYLRRIAQDMAVDDIVRWGAHRRAGWPERGEARARLTFLESLREPDDTLLAAAAQAAAWVVPDGEVLQEVLGYLQVLPSERRRGIVQRAIESEVPAIEWLLRAVLHIPDPALQNLAIDALVRLRDRAAISALARLSRTVSSEQLRQAAQVAQRRLGMRVVESAETPERPAASAWPALERVLVSEVDGDGGQMLQLTRHWGAESSLSVFVFWNDGWGIKDVVGIHRHHSGEFGESLPGPPDDGVASVAVTLAAARGIIARAVEANAATGRPIPPAFELWAPFFHDAYPPRPDDADDSIELDDAPYAGRADLMRKSDGLLEHPLFEHWFFNPDDVEPLLAQVPLPRQGRLTERQYGPLIAGLIDAGMRERLRDRLRRQAWLLAQQGDLEARDLALAVAASLAGDPTGLSKHPFLRGMVLRSLLGVIGLPFLF